MTRTHAAIVRAAVALAALAGPAWSAGRCSVRVDSRTGAIAVSAKKISGAPSWGVAPGAETTAFADAATCVRGNGARGCHLGAPGTLAATTPPAGCAICVAPPGCCVSPSGCTPGIRPLDASFPAGDPRAAAAVAVAVTCPTSADQTDSDGDGVGDACEPYGTWQRAAGTLFVDRSRTPQWIAFGADGSGQLRFVDDAGALVCGGFVFARDGRFTISLDGDADLSFFGQPAVLRYARPAADTLQLTDAVGRQATFTRVPGVPPEGECAPLAVSVRFDGLPTPEDGTGLGFDGAKFYYTNDDIGQIESIDPATGARGTPLSSSGGFVEAAQGASLWFTNLNQLTRKTFANTLLDTVSPGTFGLDRLEYAAYDPVASVLWATGSEFSPFRTVLLRIDSDADPNVALATLAFPSSIRSLAWDGTGLWAITLAQTAVRIDAATGRVVSTRALPDRTVEWTGIAAVGSELWLLGTDATGKGVLVAVTP